jgi:general secretion pathway protein A
MYEGYWRLAAAPFQNVPDPNFFFLSAQHREGLARLMYAVQQNKGAALLVGDVGCGKTTLSRALIIQLAQEKYDVGLVTNPSLPSLDFLEEIDLQLGITPSGTTKVALLRALNERLVANLREGKETVLVVDEAHSIRDPDVFEELRMLLNFQLNDRFLLTLILMAQPEITEMIGRITPLDQRIAIRYHLKPLTLAETAAYVNFRMQRAGATQSPFADEAIRLIWEHAEGVPRSLNTLCDLCLLEGSVHAAKVVDGPLAQRVLNDLG